MERSDYKATQTDDEQQTDNSQETADGDMEQDVLAKQDGIFSSATSEMPA